MRRLALLALTLALALSAVQAWAQNATFEILPSQPMAVADGQSTVQFTVQVRDSNGRLVPDGTQIEFTSTQGYFRDNIVATSNGIAIGTLVTGTVAGPAKITIRALSLNARVLYDYELVANASLLNNAQEPIRLFSAGTLDYAPEFRVVDGYSPGRGVQARFRDVEVLADRIQVNVPLYELRAVNALLIIDGVEREFDSLYLKLDRTEGFGVTELEVTQSRIVPHSRWFRVREDTFLRPTLARITRTAVEPAEDAPPAAQFGMMDLAEATSYVRARRVDAYPTRDVHFQQADIYVGGTKVWWTQPLYQMSIESRVPVVTDQFVNVSSNELAIDYPYYLSLGPGQSSLLRFKLGSRYGQGLGASSGTFLDYEINWNQGFRSNGGFTFTGIGRDDWGAYVRQFWNFDGNATLSANLQFPGNRGLYGNVNFSQPLDGYRLNYSGNAGRNVRGQTYRNQNHYITIDRDPIRIGSRFRFRYGLTSSHSSIVTSRGTRTQSSYGTSARLSLTPYSLTRRSVLNAELWMSQLTGHNVRNGLTTGFRTSLSNSISDDASAILSYDYLDDGFNADIIGRHRLSAQGFWEPGRLRVSFIGSSALDRDRNSIFSSATYRLNDLFTLGAEYTLDDFGSSMFEDYSLIFALDMDVRAIGLSWSKRTQRIGLEIFGTGLR